MEKEFTQSIVSALAVALAATKDNEDVQDRAKKIAKILLKDLEVCPVCSDILQEDDNGFYCDRCDARYTPELIPVYP